MSDNRRVRVFVSSTFRDMAEERDALMSHAWPELRRFCHEHHVELVEVDLRWGITEEQNTRRETLKLCLDEIRACRPFFVGLLGERYGWVPGDDAFTADLEDEQPWLKGLHGKSVTELEILHGVLNDPEVAGRSFFYFRDPAYSKERGVDFVSADAAAAEKQTALKSVIRSMCAKKKIPIREDYPDPRRLADMVLEDLKLAIEAQFPLEKVPDPLTREAWDHEAFAESRRRTYIGRPAYFEALDRHAAGDGAPLVLLGDSGSGKSALLANWIAHWRKAHPRDFLFQHYIGGTPDSAEHWSLMSRLVAEIKRWLDDPEELPRSHDDLLKTFTLWLAKAGSRASQVGVRFVIVLDALNQLEDHDHARLLGWLPSHPFAGALRLIVSTLPGDVLKAVEERRWTSLCVVPLTQNERRRMIVDYLYRFGKKLGAHHVDRLAAVPPAANPLYLKTVLDELRVTGTYDRLAECLNDYLAAADIPSLLRKVLDRYVRDYEHDRKGLVGEALGLMWAARRGLAETEILRLLRPANLPQLPLAIWTPLRAALEEGLVDRSGILNFAHEFLRASVETAFVPSEERRHALRLRLADDFEAQPVTARSCTELPWLLWQADSRDRLRACLLNIDRVLEILARDQDELMRYWVGLGEERAMGKLYVESFDRWAGARRDETHAGLASNNLASFLSAAALYDEAVPLMRRALALEGKRAAPELGVALSNLGAVLRSSGRFSEALPVLRQAVEILEGAPRTDRHALLAAVHNLADLLQDSSKLAEAEELHRKALRFAEAAYGPDHFETGPMLTSLAGLLRATNRIDEAERLIRRTLAIGERTFGRRDPSVALRMNNLAELLREAGRLAESEPLYREALDITESLLGREHPEVARILNNLGIVCRETKRYEEGENLYRRALAIWTATFSEAHPDVAAVTNNLARLLADTGRAEEAERLLRRSIAADEAAFGADDPNLAPALSHLAWLLHAMKRFDEAEATSRRQLAVVVNLSRREGCEHAYVRRAAKNYLDLLVAIGLSEKAARLRVDQMLREAELSIFPPSTPAF